MSERWDRHFLQLCLDHARMSKDPSTRVGAVIVGPGREPVSDGGGPPCSQCTLKTIQAGIVRVVSFTPKAIPSRWHDDLTFARSLLAEVGMEFVELAP